jgi:AsmA protein
MNKAVKWTLIVGAGLLLLVVAALLIVPKFVNLQKYKPHIEKKVSEALGRPFSMGGDLHLSLFPWAGVALSDLHVGNPPGFTEKDFLSVRSFEVRVKLWPLLSLCVRGAPDRPGEKRGRPRKLGGNRKNLRPSIQ